jgi:hypothetical protein
MAELHVLSALQARYRRVKGEIVALDGRAAKLRTDLAHIEAVIRMFQDDWRAENAEAIAPRKPSRWNRKGQGIQTALSVLRQATAPMTAREIVLAKQELYRITSTFNMALSRRVGQGVVMVDGKPKRWALASFQNVNDRFRAV